MRNETRRFAVEYFTEAGRRIQREREWFEESAPAPHCPWPSSYVDRDLDTGEVLSETN